MQYRTVSRLAVAAVLSGLALSASAADGGWYGGLSLGRSTNRFNTADFASGIPGVSESQNQKDEAYKFFAGYQFTPNFGLEGGYTDLGKFSYNYSGTTGASSNYKTHAWSLAATGTAPLGQGLSLFGKLGLALTQASDSISDPGGILAGAPNPALLGNSSYNRTAVMWGAGMEYAFNSRYALRAEYEDYGRVGDASSTGSAKDGLWSMGLKVNF
jgi:OmpA-OmpF porin, OOP family